MANTSTFLHSVVVGGKLLDAYSVTIDTTGSDLTVFTPATGNHVFVHGVIFSEGTAANLTFKSGSTTLITPEMAANQGVWSSIERDVFHLSTAKGEALVLNSSAAISSMLVYVSQNSTF